MMKNTFTLLLAFILIGGTVQQAFAQNQDTDTEQNEGGKKKNKKKKTKNTKMSKSDLTAAVDGLKSTVADLEEEKNGLLDELNQSNQEIQQLENKLATLEAQLKKAQEDARTATTAGGMENSQGLTFRVQVGAFKKIDLTPALKDPKMVTAEQVNGVSKYMIGQFQNFSDAKMLENELKRGGVKDAWLVPYNNGVRISDEEAEKLLGQPIRDKK